MRDKIVLVKERNVGGVKLYPAVFTLRVINDIFLLLP